MTITETLLALVPVYGPALLAAITFASCLALPVPASLAMLAGGAFSATGDLSLPLVSAAAFAGAMAGDQMGFWVGRSASGFLDRLAARPSRARMLRAARLRLQGQAVLAVFFTRWLVSPLGPWVNLMAGSMGVGWGRFTLGSVLGEGLWVVIYVGLGWAFAAQVDRLGSVLGTVSGLVLAVMIAAGLLRALRRVKP